MNVLYEEKLSEQYGSSYIYMCVYIYIYMEIYLSVHVAFVMENAQMVEFSLKIQSEKSIFSCTVFAKGWNYLFTFVLVIGSSYKTSWIMTLNDSCLCMVAFQNQNISI